MDIDITPAARGGHDGLAARAQMSFTQSDYSGGQSGVCEKCLCCNRHPDARREGHAARL